MQTPAPWEQKNDSGPRATHGKASIHLFLLGIETMDNWLKQRALKNQLAGAHVHLLAVIRIATFWHIIRLLQRR